MTALTTPGAYLTALREQAPLVQCITNFVAMNITANVLLAAGASPAMVHAAEEAGEFAGFAGALTVNIGTIAPDWLAGMLAAAESAGKARKVWVLDPVAHFATAYRHRAVTQLLALHPGIIRGNASEILALAGGESAARGVDARDAVEQAEAAAQSLANSQHAVVAVTGEIDFVTDGSRCVHIEGGSAWMPKVTALGCALTALVGAYVAVEGADPFDATVAALSHYAVAGEAAGQDAIGPGTFAPLFLDQLAAIDAVQLDASARISPV